jgi:hypothetical protein
MAISNVSSIISGSVGASAAQADSSSQRNSLAALPRNDASATTQLSVLGKTKSSLEDIKTSAQAVQNLSESSTRSEVAAAVQGFVKSINTLASTVKQATADTSSRSAVADARSTQALNEIRQAVAGADEGSRSSLSSIGITEREGTFSINQRQLEQSLQQNRQSTLSELSDVAERVEQTADRQLSGAPPAQEPKAAAAPAPTPEETSSDEQNEEQTRAEQRESFRQLLAAQLANAGSSVARTAVTTYFSVSSL